jgi:lycopene cyclase domain-containing protein
MKRLPTKLDILILIGLPILSFIFSLLLRSPYHVFTTLLFYGLPAAYLILRYREYSFALKDLIFILIVSTPFAIIIDYIAILSGFWFDPQSIFGARFLGVIPGEDFIWMFAATYLVIIFYQTFIDKGKRELIDKRVGRLAVPAAMLLAIFFIMVAANNTQYFLWSGRYGYLALGTLFFLLPSVLFLWRFPRFLKKSLWVIIYFCYVTLLLELTATHLNQWVFMGEYIIKPFFLFGFGPVPLEELFFVGVVGPIAGIAFYEFFDDDLV